MAVDVARAYMGERVTRVVTPARVTLTREKVPTPLRLSPYQPSPYLLRKQQATSISTQYEPGSVAPGGVRNRDGVLDENLRTPPVSRTVGRLLPVPRTNAPSSAIGYPLTGEVRVCFVLSFQDFYCLVNISRSLVFDSVILVNF